MSSFEHSRRAHPSAYGAAQRARDAAPPTLDLTACPACDQPAEVLDRFVLASTGGPLEHLRIRCLMGHRFQLPVGLLSVLTMD